MQIHNSAEPCFARQIYIGLSYHGKVLILHDREKAWLWVAKSVAICCSEQGDIARDSTQVVQAAVFSTANNLIAEFAI